jgi:L-fucose isomerase-like protein
MRCWPETFDDFGAAACSALGGLATNGVSGCCERDVYGVVTAMALREIGDSSAFVADLVDLDRDSDTATFWHCGLASTDLADPATPPRATIHSNRKKPLLNEFALKPGRVTIARISQAQNRHSLVIGGGEVVSAPRPYAGTAGVVQFDRSVDEVLDVVMREGLEHHYGIVYGDVREELEALAAIWDIPVIRL